MISNERILITGGAGFIGTSLTERLCEQNQIVVFDTLRRDALTQSGLTDNKNITLVKGDVRDREALKEAMKDCSVVIHLASIAGVDTVLNNPVPTMEISLLGTYHALACAREHGGIKRFIDFSTSEVFGRYAYKVTEADVTELGMVGEARWTYAVSKLATEHLAFSYHKQYELPALTIRPFNIYGPRQVGEGAIHHFIVRAIQNEDIQVHNDGSQIRAWCYVDDIVDGVALCLEGETAVGHAFNIGNPRSTVTIYDLAKMIVRLTSSGSKIQFVKWEHPDVELRIPNIDKAREILGFSPKIELEEGLLRTIYWYRQQLNAS